MNSLDLQIERPVAGGRMLARHDGVVTLVAGAIPGERVRAVVEKQSRQLIFARTTEVLEASPHRRPAAPDPLCGGMDYSHIAYDEQVRLKGAVIADTFHRVGKMSVPDVAVRPSIEHGYRMRAHLHVRDGRAGFFREGSHQVCDAGPSRQLLPESITAAHDVLRWLAGKVEVRGLILAENIDATERVIHVEAEWLGGAAGSLDGAAGSSDRPFDLDEISPLVTGVTAARDRLIVLAGDGLVTQQALGLRHRATSFFQSNRYLIRDVVQLVVDAAPGERIADVYAGVGLFTLALARRGSNVTAIEGDRSSGEDLEINASASGRSVRVLRGAVEELVPRLQPGEFDAVVVDPPRTGLSNAALNAVLALQAPRLVYVSCDVATLARDAGKIGTAGYTFRSVEGFDMYPGTSHVEAVAVFDR